jgi:hypothetical protein
VKHWLILTHFGSIGTKLMPSWTINWQQEPSGQRIALGYIDWTQEDFEAGPGASYVQVRQPGTIDRG